MTPRPFEVEFQCAVDRLNESVIALRVVRQLHVQRERELNEISKKFYDANPELPIPEAQ